jgi:hypothetical protein
MKPALPPVINTLPTGPRLLTPLTVRLANVPTEVMLGCAFVYTVPATNALAT